MSNSKGEFGTDGLVNKDLPQGWTLYPLEEVVEIHNSLRKPINASERSKRDGIYPYYGATGQVGWIDDFRQDGEYVLLGEDGAPFLDITKDKAYIVSGKCWVNNHAHVLKGQKGKCLNKYLLHSLNQTDFRSLVNGTTRLKLTQASLRKIPINLAPLDVQESIVAKIEELFSELDSGIASLKTAREQLKIYRQALLKHAFEGKLTEQWRKNNADKLETPEQLLARIQTERDTRYQQQLEEWKQAVKAWEEKGKEGRKLSKPAKPSKLQVVASVANLPWCFVNYEGVCELIRNGITAKPIGDSGTKIFRISAVRAMSFDLSDIRYINNEDGQYGDFFLKKGDLVFTRYNGTREYVGVCAEYKGDETHLYPDKLILTRLGVQSILSSFLEKAFATGISRNFIEEKIRTTAGQSGISGGDIKSTPIPICSLAEQQEIVSQLEEKLSIIEQNEKEIESALAKAELLRQSILKKAFSGQLLSSIQSL